MLYLFIEKMFVHCLLYVQFQFVEGMNITHICSFCAWSSQPKGLTYWLHPSVVTNLKLYMRLNTPGFLKHDGIYDDGVFFLQMLQWVLQSWQIYCSLLLPHKKTLPSVKLQNLSSWALEQLQQCWGIWLWTLKLDEERSKHVGFAQQNAFGLAIFAQFVEACKGTAMPVTPCCWLAR